MRRYALLALWSLALPGCGGALNYTDTSGPRYAAVRPAAGRSRPHFRIASFNLAYGQFPERAIALFRKDTILRDADVVLLQEVDRTSTTLIADSLGMSYVYYPASVNAASRRDFGNAILSRWPLEGDRKIVLPHLGRFGGAQRIAVAATVRFPRDSIRIYNVHLATSVTTGRPEREDQLRTVLEQARPFPRVVVGGDFNSESLPEMALPMGYSWPTRGLPATASHWTVDHVLFTGLELRGRTAVGVRKDLFDASDHLPIWVDLELEPRTQDLRPA